MLKQNEIFSSPTDNVSQKSDPCLALANASSPPVPDQIEEDPVPDKIEKEDPIPDKIEKEDPEPNQITTYSTGSRIRGERRYVIVKIYVTLTKNTAMKFVQYVSGKVTTTLRHIYCPMIIILRVPKCHFITVG